MEVYGNVPYESIVMLCVIKLCEVWMSVSVYKCNYDTQTNLLKTKNPLTFVLLFHVLKLKVMIRHDRV